MRTKGVVKIEAPIHHQVRIASAITGKNISEIVEEALVEWLKKNQSQMVVEPLKMG